MNFKTPLFLSLLAVAQHSAAAQTGSLGDGIKVENAGLDGEERIYHVACPDGQRYVLSRHFNEHKICYVNASDKDVCIESDDTDAIATQACNKQ